MATPRHQPVPTIPEFENELVRLLDRVPWNQDYLDAVLRALKIPFAARRHSVYTVQNLGAEPERVRSDDPYWKGRCGVITYLLYGCPDPQGHEGSHSKVLLAESKQPPEPIR